MKINLISVNKTMPTTPTQSSFSQIVMTISIGILIGFGVYGGMHYESILSRIAKTQNQQLQEQKADYHSVALTASTEQNSEEVVVEDQLSAQEGENVSFSEGVLTSDPLQIQDNDSVVTQEGTAESNTTGSELSTGSSGNTINVNAVLSIQEQELTRYYIGILEQDPSFTKLIDLPLTVAKHALAFQKASTLDTFHKEFQKNTSKADEKIVLILLDNTDQPYWLGSIGTGNSGDLLFSTQYGVVREGKNTLVVLKEEENEREAQALQILLPSGEEFFKHMQKICLLDLCIDTQLPLTQNSEGAWTQSIKDKIITLLPGKYAEGSKKTNGSTKSIRILQAGNSIIKQSTVINAKGNTVLFTQEALDRSGKPSDLRTLFGVPNQVRYGNIILSSPTFSFQQGKSRMIIPVQSISEFTMRLAQRIEDKQFITDQVMFQLPQGIFVTYKLSKNTYDSFDYSWTSEGSTQANAFKIVPKVVQRMNKPESYAIVEKEQDDAIAKFYEEKALSIQYQESCKQPQRFENIDPNARFALTPVSPEWDLISLVNCFQYVGQ